MTIVLIRAHATVGIATYFTDDVPNSGGLARHVWDAGQTAAVVRRHVRQTGNVNNWNLTPLFSITKGSG